MTVLLWVVAYIIVTLINRKIYINLQKLDKYYYPNPIAIFTCFLFLFGTSILLCLYIMECKTTSFIYRLFKYIPKEKDKKIKHNDEEDKREWGGC
jgi:predicted PurR-regulated permease PerM